MLLTVLFVLLTINASLAQLSTEERRAQTKQMSLAHLHRHVELAHHLVDTTKEPEFHEDQLWWAWQRRLLAGPSSSIANSGASPNALRTFVAHVRKGVTASELAGPVEEAGAVLGNYLPHNSYLVHCTVASATAVRNLNQVLWLGAYLPEHKLIGRLARLLAAGEQVPSSPLSDQASEALLLVTLTGARTSTANSAPVFLADEVAGLLADRWAATDNGRSLVAAVCGDAALQATVAPANRMWVGCGTTGAGAVPLLATDQSAVVALARWLADQTEVHVVELAGPHTMQPHLQFAKTVLFTGQQDVTGGTPAVQADGTGVTVALVDTGVDRTSCYFPANKIVAYETAGAGDTADSREGHGTSMAGAIAGVGAWPGVAQGASLHVTDVAGPNGQLPVDGGVDVTAAFNSAGQAGARVGVVAWGGKEDYFYNSGSTATSRDIDSFAHTNQAFLPVVAAGNFGYDLQPSVTGPAHSKNALVVGSCQNARQGIQQAGLSAELQAAVSQYSGLFGPAVVSSFSSRGPSADGRIKPDVVSVGEFVTVAVPGACAQSVRQGTSIAAATAAGAAALLMQSAPSSTATAHAVKAALIHSADEALSAQVQAVNGQAPVQFTSGGGRRSAAQGFGRITLNNVVPLPSTVDKTDGQVAAANGPPTQKCFSVSAGTRRLKATLVWTDPPADAAAGHQLVNDLDLVVVSQATGRTWRGNHGDQLDSLNNVEQIVLEQPGGSVFSVMVGAKLLPSGPQSFTLLVSGEGGLVSPTDCSSFGRCPGSCNGQTCAGNGQCTCGGGTSGLDCSIAGCPSCGANGYCDLSTNQCVCGIYWTGPTCSISTNPMTTVVELENVVTNYGVEGGLFGGLVFLALVVGFCSALVCGGLLGSFYMARKRKQQFGR